MGYINPLLLLPAGRRLRALPRAMREPLVSVLRELRLHAKANADISWTRSKGPMAVYWKAVSTYARHLAHALSQIGAHDEPPPVAEPLALSEAQVQKIMKQVQAYGKAVQHGKAKPKDCRELDAVEATLRGLDIAAGALPAEEAPPQGQHTASPQGRHTLDCVDMIVAHGPLKGCGDCDGTLGHDSPACKAKQAAVAAQGAA